MKSMIKILIIAAVLLTLIVLSGCGSPNTGDEAAQSAQPTAAATEEQTAESTPEATETFTSEEPVSTAEPTQAAEEKPVVFTNALFENAVRQELRVYGDTPLYPSRLAQVKELDLSQKMLSEINDIAWFTGLEKLVLTGNPDVTYIEYVGRLENLTYLDLGSTGVTDLGALASLKNLRTLRLYSVPVTDLAPLAELASLETLELDWHEFEHRDITPLAGLSNLKTLSISTDDLTPLAGLSELISLSICGCFEDLDALAGLENLQVLQITGDSRRLDISGLAGLTGLRQLMIQMADVGSLEPLAGMKSLFLLSLNGVKNDGIEPLAELTGCTDMFLTNCGIIDLTPLYSLDGLKELDISFNLLTNGQVRELRKRLPRCIIYFEG